MSVTAELCALHVYPLCALQVVSDLQKLAARRRVVAVRNALNYEQTEFLRAHLLLALLPQPAKARIVRVKDGKCNQQLRALNANE